MENIAKITPREGNAGKYRKESGFLGAYILLTPPDADAPFEPIAQCAAEIRIYGTQARNYAAAWIHAKGVYACGGGMAGGYGYHRSSAAVASALKDAGVNLSQPIGGVGESAIEGALYAIGVALGYPRESLQVFCTYP